MCMAKDIQDLGRMKLRLRGEAAEFGIVIQDYNLLYSTVHC